MTVSGYRFVAALFIIACCLIVDAHRSAYAADTRTDAIGKESSWPLAITSGSTKLTVFQPQLDSWDGFHLTARMAVRATTNSGSKTPNTS
ncbi:hypothetical protein ACFQPC_01860 [Herminiimonas glaciei]|uniref:Uncharacterized protein n=1 Tax=Herminiimonas glaciei TaxID=523788 RepID=A0ABW2I6Z1_9BURK